MQVQEAYLKLSDPVKRREYDSIDEFDDSLPLECASADFFKVHAFAKGLMSSNKSSSGLCFPQPVLG